MHGELSTPQTQDWNTAASKDTGRKRPPSPQVGSVAVNGNMLKTHPYPHRYAYADPGVREQAMGLSQLNPPAASRPAALSEFLGLRR